MAKSSLLCFLCFVYCILSVRCEDDAKRCQDLGFTGLALCSDCDSLAEFVKDDDLVSECRGCCVQDVEDSISKITYAAAILEVCIRKLAYYPNVHSFLEGGVHQYSNLKVQYHYGSPPKLILLDEFGNDKEIIRIDNWKKDQIEQFLKEKVKTKSAN